MKSQRKTWFKLLVSALTIVISSFSACSSSSDDSGAATVTTSATPVLTATSYSLGLGASTLVSVTGGSGSYVSASASVGTIYLSSASTYTYVAPTTANSAVTLSVTDSAGKTGYLVLSVGTSSSGTLTLSSSVSALTAGQVTTISVSGGSGSYTSFAASSGAIYQSSTNTFYYTAPASISSTTTATITVTDSVGNVGYAYLTLSASSSYSSINSCAGTFDATIGGVSAKIYVLSDINTNIAGYIYMSNYYYPLSGTCSLSSSSGIIQFTNHSLGQTFSGSVGLTSSDYIKFSGTMSTSSGKSYTWSATSRSIVTTTTAPTYSCQGNYSATIAGTSGTLTLIQDGSQRLAGYLYLDGYYYAMTGTCNSGSAVISLANRTTGSTYTGSIVMNGTVSLYGTFVTTSGSTYSWSATSY